MPPSFQQYRNISPEWLLLPSLVMGSFLQPPSAFHSPARGAQAAAVCLVNLSPRLAPTDLSPFQSDLFQLVGAALQRFWCHTQQQQQPRC